MPLRLLPCIALVALGALACPGARDVAGSASQGLVFARRQDGQTDLYRARLADGAVRRFGSSAESETWPYWNDTARALLFQSERPGRAAELFLWRPGAPAPEPLAPAPGRDQRWPEWSPDGSKVVFAFRGPHRASGLAEVEVSSGRETLVAAAGARDYFFRPSFSPDGRRLVAERRGPDGSGSTIWTLDAQGPRRLTAEAGVVEQKPCFTRDGASVVFARHYGAAPRQIARVPAAGGAAQALPFGQPGADEHSERPSPTRDEVAFVSDRTGNRDIWLAPLDGGEARNLTATPGHDEFAPRWSPDGERLVVTRAPPGPPGQRGENLDWNTLSLVVIDREGRVLFEAPGLMADWMPPF